MIARFGCDLIVAAVVVLFAAAASAQDPAPPPATAKPQDTDTPRALSNLLQDAKKEIDFSIAGYYRIRGFWFQDNDNKRRSPQTPSTTSDRFDSDTEFWDMRLMLNPDLKITDNIHIKAQMRILDDFVWGGSDNLDNPLVLHSDDKSSFKNAVDPPESEDDFNIERAWAEVKTPIGRLDFGRMGSNWGMGIFANDGNSLEWGIDGMGDDRGDTVDRIKLIMKFGDLYVVPIMDRVAENSVDDADQDIHDYIISILYKTENIEVGTYDGFRDSDDLDTSVYFFDVYAKAKLGIIVLTSEFFYLGGEMDADPAGPTVLKDIDIDALQGVIRLDAELADDKDLKLTTRLELGWASGSDDEDFVVRRSDGAIANPIGPGGGARRRMRGIGFHPDYDVDYLLFEHYLGNVQNAYFAKLAVDATIQEEIGAFAQVVYARAAENTFIMGRNDQRINVGGTVFPGGMQFGDGASDDGSQDLGVELDVGASWKIELFKVSYVFAVLFPGEAFDLSDSRRAQVIDAIDAGSGARRRRVAGTEDDTVILGSFIQAAIEF